MRNAKNEGRRWLRQAEHNLQSARYMLDGGFYGWACFLAQQAAEAALKAFLLFKGERGVLSHSIAELRQISIKHDKIFIGLASTSKLDTFYIPTRYPNALPGGVPFQTYNRADAEEAIGLAREVMETVRSLLGGQNDA